MKRFNSLFPVVHVGYESTGLCKRKVIVPSMSLKRFYENCSNALAPLFQIIV